MNLHLETVYVCRGFHLYCIMVTTSSLSLVTKYYFAKTKLKFKQFRLYHTIQENHSCFDLNICKFDLIFLLFKIELHVAVASNLPTKRTNGINAKKNNGLTLRPQYRYLSATRSLLVFQLCACASDDCLILTMQATHM